MTGRILGLDPGERRVGVALSDPSGTIASPYTVIDRRSDDLRDRLRAICHEEGVRLIVVGLPTSLSGHEGPSAAMARALAALAGEATGLPVEMHDERFTSSSAETALLGSGMRRAARAGRRDMVAAALILQGFLESRARGGTADEHG